MDYPFPDPRDSRDTRYDEFDTMDTMNVSSGQDCTGLIPASPSASEEENYNELYDFLPKAVSDGKNDGC